MTGASVCDLNHAGHEIMAFHIWQDPVHEGACYVPKSIMDELAWFLTWLLEDA